jgi:hypothetical protein
MSRPMCGRLGPSPSPCKYQPQHCTYQRYLLADNKKQLGRLVLHQHMLNFQSGRAGLGGTH